MSMMTCQTYYVSVRGGSLRQMAFRLIRGYWLGMLDWSRLEGSWVVCCARPRSDTLSEDLESHRGLEEWRDQLYHYS
jgi:hypothetical protein